MEVFIVVCWGFSLLTFVGIFFFDPDAMAPIGIGSMIVSLVITLAWAVVSDPVTPPARYVQFYTEAGDRCIETINGLECFANCPSSEAVLEE